MVPVITYNPKPDLIKILSCFEGLMPLLPLLPVQSADWARMVSTLSAICPGDGWAVSGGEWAVVTSRHLDTRAANKGSRGFHYHGEGLC